MAWKYYWTTTGRSLCQGPDNIYLVLPLGIQCITVMSNMQDLKSFTTQPLLSFRLTANQKSKLHITAPLWGESIVHPWIPHKWPVLHIAFPHIDIMSWKIFQAEQLHLKSSHWSPSIFVQRLAFTSRLLSLEAETTLFKLIACSPLCLQQLKPEIGLILCRNIFS